MTDIFVNSCEGFQNLRMIRGAGQQSEDGWALETHDGVIIETGVAINKVIVSMITPQGRWQCLTVIDDGAGDAFVQADPVLAWGMTAIGELVPVTAMWRDGVFEEDYALRATGADAVYDSSSGEHDNAEAWLRVELRKRARAAEREKESTAKQ